MSAPRVLITRPVPEDAVHLLREGGRCDVAVLRGSASSPIPSEAELVQAVDDVDVLFTLPAHPITRAVIDAGPRLRLIATLGTGYDNIDVAAARARGIAVTNAPGILDETTADLAFALLLAAARRLPESERFLREGRFHGWTPFLFAGPDVHGRTLGIVGLGRIGAAVARRATGFGMRLLYTGPSAKPELEARLGARRVPLDELLRESDFVSLHVPLTAQTRHLIDAAALARMKRGAVLINTARGPVVDEGALAASLRAGHLGGCGLDVFEREPAVHPDLIDAPGAVLLPHIGSASADTRRRMALRAAENVRAFLEGRPLLDPVS